MFVAAGMLTMPPWRDLEVPPFGSKEHFAGYSPFFHPPHDPWTLPLLTDRDFWNAQHEYRRNWPVLGIQELAGFLLTVVAALSFLGRGGRRWSIPGALLGGIGALIIGLIGVTAVMAPLLEIAPRSRVMTTSLLFACYLAAIVASILIGARLRLAIFAKQLTGLAAGQTVVAYIAFALLPDESPSSHRMLLVVWLISTAVGAVAGLVWARTSATRDLTPLA